MLNATAGATASVPRSVASFRSSRRRRISTRARRARSRTACADAVEEWLAGWDANGAEWEFWVERSESFRAAVARLLRARGRRRRGDDVRLTGRERTRLRARPRRRAEPDRDQRVRVPDDRPDRARAGAARRRGRSRPAGRRTARSRPSASPRRSTSERRSCAARRSRTARGTATTSPRSPRPRTPRARSCSPTATRPCGAVDLDVRSLGADVVTGGTVKYLLGTAGLGFMWLRREVLRAARPDADGLVRRRGHLRDVDRRLLAAPDRTAVRLRHAAGSVALRGGRRYRRSSRRRVPRRSRRTSQASSTGCSTGSRSWAPRWRPRASRRGAGRSSACARRTCGALVDGARGGAHRRRRRARTSSASRCTSTTSTRTSTRSSPPSHAPPLAARVTQRLRSVRSPTASIRIRSRISICRPAKAGRGRASCSSTGASGATGWDRTLMTPLAIDLAGRGYRGVERRVPPGRAGGGGWPGTLEDVAAAIDHLAAVEQVDAATRRHVRALRRRPSRALARRAAPASVRRGRRGSGASSRSRRSRWPGCATSSRAGGTTSAAAPSTVCSEPRSPDASGPVCHRLARGTHAARRAAAPRPRGRRTTSCPSRRAATTRTLDPDAELVELPDVDHFA